MKLLNFLDERLEERICVFVLAAMTLVIFIQIIIRAISVYVTIPMAWTEEIGRYLFIYAVYVGAAYATRRRAHQKVDIFPILCGDTGKLIFNLIGDVGVLVFAAAMTFYGWQTLQHVAFDYVQYAPATKINMGYAYAGPVLGMLLCAFRSIENVVFHIKSYRQLCKGTKGTEGGAV